MEFAQFKTRFDTHLEEFVASALSAFSATLSDPPLSPFIAHTQELALAGGKRVRPYLAYLMASESGYPEDELLRCVLAWELFHLFALVHDDVMDGGEERHGVPTAHVFLAQQNVPQKVAEGQAILLGDLLLSFAHQTLLNIGERGIIPRDRLHVAHTIFCRMSREVIAGQMLDLDLTTRAPLSLDEIPHRNFLKTSSYTFIRPMQFGVAIDGGSAQQMQFCLDFGTHVGQAFQLQDDLLDVRGGDTGKTGMRDIREGQQTALTQFVFAKGTPAQQKLLRDHLGKNVTKKDEEALRKLFEETGTFAHLEGLIVKSYSAAEALLEQAEISRTSRTQLQALIAMLQGRTA